MVTEPFSSSLSSSTFTFSAGAMFEAASASKAVRNIMIGPLSSEDDRAKTRRSPSSGEACSRAVSTISHLPSALRCFTTAVHGLFCAHCSGSTGWPSKCM